MSDVGPTLLARMLELNDVQEGVLTVAFHVADKEGLLLLDLEDLRALLAYVGENAQAIGREAPPPPALQGLLEKETRCARLEASAAAVRAHILATLAQVSP